MAGTSRGHSGSPRQQPRHLAKKRRTSTGDAAREERIQERLASRGNSTDITSDSNLKDEDEEDTDADSDGYTSSEDGAATQSPTRTALQEYRLPPPRSSSRAAPSVENEDFSPTDLDAYHALPLPRVRVGRVTAVQLISDHDVQVPRGDQRASVRGAATQRRAVPDHE